MANYNNFSISNGKGKLYLKSQQPKEGYEEVTYGTDNRKTYHKYFDSIKGQLKYFDVKETEYQNKKLTFLEVTLVDGDDYNKVSAPLKNTKGNYTDEVKALLSALNSADVGEEVTLSVKKTTSESKGKTYNNLNVYINYVNRLGENNKGLSTGFISFNDIPKPIKEEDEDLGDTWNWKPVNKFYAQKIKEIDAKFKSTVQPVSTPQPKQEEPKSSFNPPANTDLPF